MSHSDVLAFVLAGGQGSRLKALTDKRAKPAVPFAGSYRLIDFPLSNCLHSAISDVWVAQQYQPASLNDHLSNGRPWDLDRTTGGLLVLPPYQGSGREGWTQGTADGLWRNAQLIRELGPEFVVVMSADAVYRLDYRDVVRAHQDTGAVLTMVTTQVDRQDASRYGVVEVDGDRTGGRVTRYAYKPDEPTSDVVTNEVFVFRPAPVLDLLEQLADEAGEDGVGDLGDKLLPALVEGGDVRSFGQPGYWRDVGTVEAYWQANMDFLSDDPPFDLDDPELGGAQPGRAALVGLGRATRPPSGRRCWPPRPRSRATSSTASSRPGRSSRRARAWSTASCCPAPSYGPARTSSARSSTTTSRSAATRTCRRSGRDHARWAAR